MYRIIPKTVICGQSSGIPAPPPPSLWYARMGGGGGGRVVGRRGILVTRAVSARGPRGDISTFATVAVAWSRKHLDSCLLLDRGLART